MSRSAAIRSRIEAFESGKPVPILSESPPNNSWTFVSKPSNHISPLDEPLSPTALTVAFINPDPVPVPKRPRSRSPPILGRNSSLVDVSEVASVVSSAPSSVKSTSDYLINLKPSPPTKSAPPVPPRNPSSAIPPPYPSPSSPGVSEFVQDKDLSSRPSLNHKVSSASFRSASGPPLPPRRSDTGVDDKILNNVSLPPKLNLQDRNWTGSSTSTSSWQNISPHSQSKPESRLTPGLMLPRPGHTHVNSASSFQSVSLSDGGSETTDPKESSSETPSRSVAEAVAALNLISDNKTYASSPPGIPSITVPYAPRLPPRRRGTQVTTPVSSSTPAVLPAKPPPPPRPGPLTSSKNLAPGYSFPSVQLPSFSIRRLAPPPPVLSSGSPTSTFTPNSSSSSLHGTTYSPVPLSSSKPASIASDRSGSGTSLNVVPVPGVNRKRYEALFERNLAALRQPGRHTDPPSSRPSSTSSGGSGWRSVSATIDGRLPGRVVKRIWLCSKLERSFLRRLWTELDKESIGCLDQESFVQGMWRIDTELTKIAGS